MLIQPVNDHLRGFYSSVLPSNARSSVTSSIYSRSPPTGTPLAILLTLIPAGLISLLIYIAVVSPSTLELADRKSGSAGMPDHFIHIPLKPLHQFFQADIPWTNSQHRGNSTMQNMINSIIFSGLFIRC